MGRVCKVTTRTVYLNIRIWPIKEKLFFLSLLQSIYMIGMVVISATVFRENHLRENAKEHNHE